MDETDSKSGKIDELLNYIEERLAELESEKEELREYQEKDKERRCLDYALKDSDLNRIDAQIAELDQLQRMALGRDGDDKLEFEEREKEIEVLFFLGENFVCLEKILIFCKFLSMHHSFQNLREFREFDIF